MHPVNLILGVANIGCAALCFGLAVPLWRGKVARNRLYGARFAESLASDEAWYAINQHAGRQLMVWSAALAGLGILCFWLPLQNHPAVAVLAGLFSLVLLIPCLSSYRFGRRHFPRGDG